MTREVHFNITYQAGWQQELYILGSTPFLGEWVEHQALRLHSADGLHWCGSITLPVEVQELSYIYLVRDKQGDTVRREWKPLHQIQVPSSALSHIYCYDLWIDRPKHTAYYSSAFYDVLYRRTIDKADTLTTSEQSLLRLTLLAPTIPQNKVVYLSGATDLLGNWQVDAAQKMLYLGQGRWQIDLPIDEATLDGHIEFKYFVADLHRYAPIWEEGDNRVLSLEPNTVRGSWHIHSGATLMAELPQTRVAGLVAPLFSMRHDQDFGIGDFRSLREHIDWAEKTGLHVLQILPINDTTFYRDWRDSYPYNAISTDALNPIYIDLLDLEPLSDSTLQGHFVQEAKSLREATSVLYPQVATLKEKYLRQHFDEYGKATARKRAYKSFVQDNKSWLIPYIAFCILRDRHPNTCFDSWGAYQAFDRQAIEAFIEQPKQQQEAKYHIYTQYLLHEQLSAVAKYAEERGVVLKGDLPIGVAPHSVEVWTQATLFHTNRSAGAPPDDFARDGQNWGFPTYNWERMQEDNLAWWQQRFSRLGQYFKAIRIDHILGFFRIWEIPMGQCSGVLGHFNPAHPQPLSYWQQQLGFNGDITLLCRPIIAVGQAEELFGSYLTLLIQDGFLLWSDSHQQTLSPRYSEQKRWLSVSPNDIAGGNDSITKLIELCKEVALIADSNDSTLYHPRIAFERSLRFATWEKHLQDKWLQLSHGYFYEWHNTLWQETAHRRLSSICQSTDMLICAEDLGMIPKTVPETLEALGILSLELERMPKNLTASGYSTLQDLPYISVCTTSTHDMPPLRAWWQTLSYREQAEYIQSQQGNRGLSLESASDKIYRSIITAHLSSPSMLVVLPMQDWLSIDGSLHLQQAKDEQINHPENAQQHWGYRLPLSMRELQERAPQLSTNIKLLLETLGRE